MDLPTPVFYGIMRRAAKHYGEEVEDYLKNADPENALKLITHIHSVIDNDITYIERSEKK
jgi:hypothetical protein